MGIGDRVHRAVSGYLRRAARSIAAAADLEHACAVGRAAVEFALEGKNALMPALRRSCDEPYRRDIVAAPLAEIANREKLVPADFITPDSFAIVPDARRYLTPLIQGEAYPPFKNGLPAYVKLRNARAPKRLAAEFAL